MEGSQRYKITSGKRTGTKKPALRPVFFDRLNLLKAISYLGAFFLHGHNLAT